MSEKTTAPSIEALQAAREQMIVQKNKALVLDKGYVNLVEHWGSDERIIEAARMSTNKGFLGWGPKLCHGCKDSPIPGTVFIKQFIDDGMGSEMVCGSCKGTGEAPGDEKLLKYLWDHKHLTPFEMAGATFEIYAPIFVIREWHRHRTFSYNEMSGRYVELPDDYYEPSLDRILTSQQSSTNKQGSESGIVPIQAEIIGAEIAHSHREARRRYEWLLSMGVAREVARMVLPVAQYSRFRASGNLRNWLHFLKLRLDKAAQHEIREYAKAVGSLLQFTFPRTYALFEQGRADSR